MTDAHDPFEEIDLRPLAESPFAVEHGLIRSAPDVAIDGRAVRRARLAAGLTADDAAREMAVRGYATDVATIASLEDSPAYRLPPREARLLAALIDLPLNQIEARAEPWPTDPGDLAALHDAGVDVLLLGADAVVRTATGSYLGLLRCAGDPTVLGSRTYRLVAATLLNGAWSHLAGVLLVTRDAPHRALAVDALDCVTRSHAPSGLLGYSRLAEAEPVAEAVAAYDRAYTINWAEPPPLAGILVPDEPLAERWATRVGLVAGRLAEEGRRSRQPGKGPGYAAVAEWLRRSEPGAIAVLVDELAELSEDAAAERLHEAVALAPADGGAAATPSGVPRSKGRGGSGGAPGDEEADR
jgi:hypothetical protein